MRPGASAVITSTCCLSTCCLSTCCLWTCCLSTCCPSSCRCLSTCCPSTCCPSSHRCLSTCCPCSCRRRTWPVQRRRRQARWRPPAKADANGRSRSQLVNNQSTNDDQILNEPDMTPETRAKKDK